MISMNELYLITGAAGHLGSTLVRKLLELEKNIRALVLPDEKNIPEGDIEVCYGDIRNKESLTTFFDNPQNNDLILIHCAGIVTIATKYVKNVYDVNVTGTKNIVDLSQKHMVKKLVYVSSVEAIPEKKKGEIISEITAFNPDDVVGLYAKTKSEATSFVLEAAKKGLNACVVQPTGIAGPFDQGEGPFTTLVIEYYKGHLTSAVTGGFDFVDVRDVAKGIIACVEKGRPGQVYILSNKYFTIKEILYMLHQITGKKEIKRFLPLWFLKIVAAPAEAYYKILKRPPLFTIASIKTIHTNARYSHEKANLELGYSTRDMKETLTDTINWLKENQRL